MLSTAKWDEQKMKDNMDSKFALMNQAESAMKSNVTEINTDGNSKYVPVELDKEKMKYIPYSKKGEVINESKTSSGNISSDTTSKDTVASPLEKKPELSEFDTKFNEAVERITILEPITKDKLKSAIKTLSNEAQEWFLKDPLLFRDRVTIWQKIDKQYRGNFWNKILTILSNQEQKGRINSDYNIDRFSQDNVDKIPNDEKKKLVFSETDLDDIATLLWIKESDINTLPYAHKDFNGQWIQYGRYKDQYWKVVWEFKNGVITWKWACIRSSSDKYIWGWEHGEMSWTGNYIHHDGRILSKNDR